MDKLIPTIPIAYIVSCVKQNADWRRIVSRHAVKHETVPPLVLQVQYYNTQSA